MDTRRDPGQYYPGGKVISTRPVATDGDVKHSDFEDLDVKTNTLPDLRAAVKGLAARLGATVVTALAVCVAIGATVEKAKLNELDFDADPSVVTNVTFEGLATSSNVYTKAETEAKIVELAPAPGNYSVVSNRAMNAVQTEADPVFDAWTDSPQVDHLDIVGTEFSTGMIPLSGNYSTYNWRWYRDYVAITRNFYQSRQMVSNQTVRVYLPDYAEIHDNDTFLLYSQVPSWAMAASKPSYTAGEVGAYSTDAIDAILQGYLPLDYFKDGQTIPMYWGDGTKLCDFGANWLGNLVNTVSEKPDVADIPPAVSNIVTTALVRERLGVYLYVGADGGIYVHTNED